MTEELKQKAENYCNHLQSLMLAYTPENPRQQRTVTLLDIEDAYIAGATENGIVWHENEEPEEHKEIIARSQSGCTLIANYYDNAWRNIWTGGIIDFENLIVRWAYVKLPKE